MNESCGLLLLTFKDFQRSTDLPVSFWTHVKGSQPWSTFPLSPPFLVVGKWTAVKNTPQQRPTRKSLEKSVSQHKLGSSRVFCECEENMNYGSWPCKVLTKKKKKYKKERKCYICFHFTCSHVEIHGWGIPLNLPGPKQLTIKKKKTKTWWQRFWKMQNAKTHVLMCSFLPRCISLQSWCYRKSGVRPQKKEQGIISTVRSLSQPAAITIPRSLQSARRFHYRGSNGSLTSSPIWG